MMTSTQLLEKGEILDWAGIVRDRPCETAIASTEAVCINIPIDYFLELIDRTPQLEALWQAPLMIPWHDSFAIVYQNAEYFWHLTDRTRNRRKNLNYAPYEPIRRYYQSDRSRTGCGNYRPFISASAQIF